MARVVGLDIGTSSVRAVVLETVMRAYELVEVVEEPIAKIATNDDGDPEASAAPAEAEAEEAPAEEAGPENDGPDDAEEDVEGDQGRFSLGEPVLDALRRLAARGVFEADAVFAALAPDDVLLTKVTLPFANDRDIEPVLAPQLEGRIPGEVEDLAIDFVRGARLESGEYVIYAAGVEPGRLRVMLAELGEIGVDPKVIDVPPLPLMTAGRALVPSGDGGPIAVVDIGATSTGVAIFDASDLQYARSFPGGGDRVTEALAETFGLDFETAREGKHREGFIDLETPESAEPTGQDAVDIANACRNGSKALVRQLRRTLHAHATEWGTPVETVYLCGGGAALPGLVEYVGQSLGVDTRAVPLDAPELASVAGFADVGLGFTTALGLALRGTNLPGRSTMNARVGEFAFKGSYEYVRQRAPQIALGVAVLLFLALTFALGRISLLKSEIGALDDALGTLSTAVFGEAETDPGEISRRLRLGSVRPSFVPAVSAYALFADISQTVGGTLDLGYELEATDIEVDLERRILRIEGTADSAESVDTFEAELDARPCFESIERTDLSQRRGTEDFAFSIQGEVRCSDEPEEEEE